MGERVPEPVDHPVIRPSINAMAETYRLATERPELAQRAHRDRRLPDQPLPARADEPDDLVTKHEMQRELGRRTGTCFQRCVGLDAISTCHSVTFDIDAQDAAPTITSASSRSCERAQIANVVIGGAMTDPKGDRSKPPHQQADLDLFLHVVRRDEKGIYVSGAKMHQTGAVNSHWLIFMPTMRLTEADRDWAVVGAVRVDAPGLTYIVGRQTNDTRVVDGGALDAGNAQFAGQESLIVFDDVFVPYEHVFMDGEWDYASTLVERFTTYHRSSYVCKTGLGDVLIGAAAAAAEYNGVESRLAHQGQARRDDASQRDDLFELHGGRAPVEADGVGRLSSTTRCSRTSPSTTSRASRSRSRGWRRTSPAGWWSPCRPRRTCRTTRSAR